MEAKRDFWQMKTPAECSGQAANGNCLVLNMFFAPITGVRALVALNVKELTEYCGNLNRSHSVLV